MSDQQGGRPADPTTADTIRTTTLTTELYETAFTTRGRHPFSGIAIAATIEEARQRRADIMLIFADPTGPITALHRAEPVDQDQGIPGEIYRQVNNGEPGRTVIARPLTTTSASAADAAAREW